MSKTCILIGLLMLLSGLAGAATLPVPSFEYPTIQAGVDSAGAGDTVLVADGVYVGTGNRDIEFHGWDIVLISENGPEVTIIDCEGSEADPHRAFSFFLGETREFKIEGFTIRNGFNYYSANSVGGAVDVRDASPTFEDCKFDHNISQVGGAIYYLRSAVELVNCEFTDNQAGWGGAVAARDCDSLSFLDCTFERNLALGEDSLFGVGGLAFSVEQPIDQPDLTGGISIANRSATYWVSEKDGLRIGRAVSDDFEPPLDPASRGLIIHPEHVLSAGPDSQASVIETVIQDNPMKYILDTVTSRRSVGVEASAQYDTAYYNWNGGGAIRAWRSAVSFRNCQIVENRAMWWGAGVYCSDSSSVSIDSCYFSLNRAGNFCNGSGAAISLFSTVEVSNSRFEGNWGCSAGGGLLLDYLCQASIRDCSFRRNQARASGGALAFKNQSTADIIDCEIVDNELHTVFGRNGTGLYSLGSSLRVVNTPITGNVSEEVRGGGASIWEGTVEFESCVIAQNVNVNRINSSYGGGLYLRDCKATVTNCTISDNLAGSGGNVYLYISNGGPFQASFKSSIISFAKSGLGILAEGSVDSLTIENCNIYGNLSYDGPQAIIAVIEANDNFSEVPLFCDRPECDYRVAAESPCLPENNSWGQLVGTLGVGCDLEPETWRVSADGSGDAPNIQAAIDAATHGDTVYLSEGTYTGAGNYDIDFRGKLVVLASEKGPELTVIDCEATPTQPRRAFYFGSAEDRRAVVMGLSITNGYTMNGGAIFCDYWSSPTFFDCVISGNQTWRVAGGVVVQGSEPLFKNCVFQHNRSNLGGALYLNYAGPVELENCTIVNNWAGGGGAIACWRSEPASIAKSIMAFQDNSGSGGLVYCESGGPPGIVYTDIFGNEDGDWVGCIASLYGVNGNVSVDPLFCDTTANNYRLLHESPCAPWNNASGVLMGARGVGCDPTDVEEPDLTDSEALPKEFALSQNYPNPFNPVTTLSYALPRGSHVEITVYNILGQHVTNLVDKERPAGEYTVTWYGNDSNGQPVSTGVYLYRIKAGDFVETKKMLLLK